MNGMRSTRTLMAQISQIDHLMAAWKKVRANKGAAGVDLVTIQQFEANLYANLQALAETLREDRYYPLPVKRFGVPKPDGRTRPLAILAVEDRIVQRAVLDALEPMFEAEFLPCSYGYRQGRKAADAIQQLLQYQAQGYRWVVDGDIRDFFGSLDHRILMRFLADRIKDKQVLRLIQMWLDLGGMRPAPEGTWGMALEAFGRSRDYLGDVLDRTVDSFLDRGKVALWSTESALPGFPADGTEEDARRELRQEYLKQLGRDGLLLLLTHAKGASKLFTPWGLGIATSALLLGLAAPTVGQIIAERRFAPIGSPQGAVISSLLANLYLHHFDLLMVKQGYALVRFGDDFVICCPNEARAQQALEAARRRLTELRLTLHEEKTKIVRFEEGFTFLGYTLDGQGARLLPARRHSERLIEVGRLVKEGAHTSLQRGKTLLRRERATESV
jgi:RNA-directed DNA polymerase